MVNPLSIPFFLVSSFPPLPNYPFTPPRFYIYLHIYLFMYLLERIHSNLQPLISHFHYISMHPCVLSGPLSHVLITKNICSGTAKRTDISTLGKTRQTHKHQSRKFILMLDTRSFRTQSKNKFSFAQRLKKGGVIHSLPQLYPIHSFIFTLYPPLSAGPRTAAFHSESNKTSHSLDI